MEAQRVSAAQAWAELPRKNTRYNGRMRRYRYFIVAVVIGIILASLSSCSPGDSGSSILRSDTIDNPSRNGAIFAQSEADLAAGITSTGAMSNLGSSGRMRDSNPDGYQRLALEGRVQGLPQGTRVSVLTESESAAKVTVEDGLLKGKTGFVPPQVLKGSKYKLDPLHSIGRQYGPR